MRSPVLARACWPGEPSSSNEHGFESRERRRKGRSFHSNGWPTPPRRCRRVRGYTRATKACRVGFGGGRALERPRAHFREGPGPAESSPSPACAPRRGIYRLGEALVGHVVRCGGANRRQHGIGRPLVAPTAARHLRRPTAGHPAPPRRPHRPEPLAAAALMRDFFFWCIARSCSQLRPRPEHLS